MSIFCACKILLNATNCHNVVINRYIRNISRRGGGPKFLKGTIKSIDETEGDDFSRIKSYEDVMEMVEPQDKLLVEKALTSEDDFGSALGEEGASEFKYNDDKPLVKKKIIARKHFKRDLAETNLLTVAAKEQIRHLHEANPTEWTPEALSQCFPITVKGVKKLLKSYFILKNPDEIKRHDEDIEEKWKALESDDPSIFISPYTRQLWKEGKISKQNYRSNPDLPSASVENSKTVIFKKPITGQYSAIVQQYMNYKNKKESEVEPCDGKEVLSYKELRNMAKEKRAQKFKFSNYNYRVEDEERNPVHTKNLNRIKLSKRIDCFDDLDVVHSQYTANLKDEKSVKELSSDPQYAEWRDKQMVYKKPEPLKKGRNPDVFTKITKFKIEDSTQQALFYEKLEGNRKPGFQNGRYKLGNRKNSQINSKNKNTLYREGQSVYNEHGQFLYKIPFKS